MQPIILLTGENTVFRREHADTMTKGLLDEELSVYYADETRPGVIFSQCTQSSLFSSSNIIIVRNVDGIKQSSKAMDEDSTPISKAEFERLLLAYIDEPNMDTNLIIEWEKPSAKVVKAASGKKWVEVKTFKKAYRRDIASFIQNKLSSQGINFDNSVVELILTASSEDIEQAQMMVKNLISYSGETHELSYEDAKAMLSRSHNLTIFPFLDALFKKNKAKALNALGDMRLEGESPILINTMILQQARLLWGISTNRGAPNLAGMMKASPQRIKKLEELVPHINLKFLSGIIDLSARVEEISKSMSEDFAFLELETFILGI